MEIVPDPITVSVALAGLGPIAPNVCVCRDVSMGTAKPLLSANVNLDGLECFAINLFARTLVSMVIAAYLANASKFF